MNCFKYKGGLSYRHIIGGVKLPTLMMGEWTNPDDILHDLAIAQTGFVPASLEVFDRKQPPPIKIEEETEAEFHECCGDGDFSKPPDYQFIREMLAEDGVDDSLNAPLAEALAIDSGSEYDEEEPTEEELREILEADVEPDIQRFPDLSDDFNWTADYSTFLGRMENFQEKVNKSAEETFSVSSHSSNTDLSPQVTIVKPRSSKNVAITSILDAQAKSVGNGVLMTQSSEPEVKLSSPNRPTQPNAVELNRKASRNGQKENTEINVSSKGTVKSITNRVPKQPVHKTSKSPSHGKQISPLLKLPIFTFKEKSPMKKDSSESMSDIDEKSNTDVSICKQYVPSAQAQEYYLNKYNSRAKQKMTQNIKEDIWTNVVQKMKEIDERMLSSPCSSSQDGDGDASNESTPKKAAWDEVNLPEHRHALLGNMEDCIVCCVTAKHGYYI